MGVGAGALDVLTATVPMRSCMPRSLPHPLTQCDG